MHLDRECAYDEVVAHLDDTEGLLKETDDESNKKSCKHADGTYQQTFAEEDLPHDVAFHTHAAQSADITFLVDDEQR